MIHILMLFKIEPHNHFPANVKYHFFCVLSDVSCQIWGAVGSSLSVGGVTPANLFPGDDIRNPVSRTTLEDTRV